MLSIAMRCDRLVYKRWIVLLVRWNVYVVPSCIFPYDKVSQCINGLLHRSIYDDDRVDMLQYRIYERSSKLLAPVIKSSTLKSLRMTFAPTGKVSLYKSLR